MSSKITVLATSMLLAAGLFATGCSNSCQDAVDHVDECKAADSTLIIDADECSELDQCKADCISDTSCDTLNRRDPAGVQAYWQCVAACN